MKTIPLSNGGEAVVDDEDYEVLSSFTWFRSSAGYAQRRERVDGRLALVLMHRAILGTPKGMHTDHINRDTLDNRRENLRVCTPAENQRNRKQHANSRQMYKGVECHMYDRHVTPRYRARIRIERRVIRSKFFRTAEEAARAYDALAIQYHGEFASLNFARAS